MPDTPNESIHRRDFMIASVASVGASAAFVASAAHAQQSAAPAPGSAAAATQGTVYTGDVVQAKKVISALDVDDLEPGKKHAFYFQGVQMPTGQHWYVSVMVAKGARPGKRVALVSGVHGDEISPVHTIQTVINLLDPAEMSGTVLAVFDLSRPAMEGMARRWPNSGRGVDLIDINRVFPGNENGADAPTRHAGLVFDRLFKGNVDYAIDFHTAATGMDMTAFHLARMDLPEVRAMAELFPIDQIFDNPAYPGLPANAFIDAGIPAFTPEIGRPRILDLDMIPSFVEGTMNVLKHHGVIPGPVGRTGKDTDIFIADSMFPVIATHGGFVELLVKLNDKVEAGQKVAIQRDTFGEVVAEYTSGVAGEVAARHTDATCEPGTGIIFIIFDGATATGGEVLPE
ncbi:succinylglutamate desuccinylase/aspartoacylase family protein [Aquamicrobium sp. LC103]|uniref:M14 family metallopeptidase n=1 Tax=Aquamicrobium sp. LC103 TaxID=1120658 RepID=UPI00063EBAB1|nr:succinylglutamate desuccinylase/aspartoacylase family protein [Aquamicrobium sp. LC103]TKT78205.1 succinylglutamate desuccinylase/aspartoacylase family protein [Aquamicrobium sp. LC103]